MSFPDLPTRHLAWDACANARDLGGLPLAGGGTTRWRAVIRTDRLSHLTPAGQAAMHAYGVRTVIDLRSLHEAAADPYDLPASHACRRHNLPIEEYYPHVSAQIAQAPSIAAVYCLIADYYVGSIAAVLAAIAAAPEGGVVIHCHAGKDRTGMIAALLLALAGVPAHAIAADYALSQARLWPRYEARLRWGEVPPGNNLWSRPVTDPATMRAFLAHLEEQHGGAAAYLRAGGLRAASCRALRRRLGA